jgi:hypothetical protein
MVQEVVLCSFAFLACADAAILLAVGILELTGLGSGHFWGDWKWKDPLSDQLQSFKLYNLLILIVMNFCFGNRCLYT